MKIKVCGLKYKDNIACIAEFQPDYMGFIFYNKSKRFVGENFEMPILPSTIIKVGVFVNATIEYALEKIKFYNLGAVQLHGDETVDFCFELKNKLIDTNVSIVKAFGIDESFDFDSLANYAHVCDYFLFDTKTSDYGGSGKQFNWNVLEKYNQSVPFFLSGGIGIEELKKLKTETIYKKIFAIDVNSKFEVSPGLKNIEMIEKLKDLNLK